MSKNDEIEINIMNGNSLGLKRENSEKKWFETMVEREINSKSKKKLTLNKDNSTIRPPKTLLSNKEQDFFEYMDLFNVSIPNFSRLSITKLNSIDIGKRENGNNNISEKKQEKLNYEKYFEKKPSDTKHERSFSKSNMIIENEKYEKQLKKAQKERKVEKNKKNEKIKIKKINDEPEQKYLENLLSILKTIFKNKKFDGGLNLDEGERKILKAIVERKYKEENLKANNLIEMKTSIKEKMSQTSKKRPEENYKFIFKLCLKNMKEELKKKIKKPIRKKEFEKYFYDFYFKKISEDEAIPIEHFHHPKNSKALKKLKSKSKDMPKTINQYYIENISKSKDFLDKFLNYLNQDLLLEYEQSIDSKLEGLVTKWSNSIFEKDCKENKEKEIEVICSYMKKNKKCKLPWNIVEIQEAIKSTKNLFS